MHRPTRNFIARPLSPRHQKLVDLLQTTLDEDGLDVLERLLASVTWAPRRELAAKQRGIPPCRRDTARDELPPGCDHLTFYGDKGSLHLTSEIYSMDRDLLLAVADHVRKHDRDVKISAELSSHFPGRTFLLEYSDIAKK